MIENLLNERIQPVLTVIAEAQAKPFLIQRISSSAITVEVQVIGKRQLTPPVAISGTFHQDVRRVHGMNGPQIGDLVR